MSNMDNKKQKLSMEDLLSLCDYDEVNDRYISKSGNDYIDSLSKLYDLKNKNDKPFTVDDIIKQPTLNEFNFDGLKEFKYIGDLTTTPMIIKNGKRQNEKIIVENMTEENKKIYESSQGLVYLITCQIGDNEHIIKIGQSRKTFKERLSSYNCGCVFNWRTASTTNIKILQSFLATRQKFKLYICDCSDDLYTIEWYGVKSVSFSSPKSLAIEDIMVKQFIQQFNKKPLTNIQANADN